ncbi:MAG: hypothetical protein GQ574_26605 [Crocinitomix sp.]|nr:hypothetical protein [Crocinitomix sp.]
MKLAFVVDYGDKEMVLNILKINSTVWGGHFNPIIPFKKNKSGIWKKRGKNRSMKDLLKDYIRNFNPDYIIDATKDNKVYSVLGQTTVLINTYQTFLGDDFEVGTRMDFLYQRLYENGKLENAKEPLNIVIPQIQKDDNEIFLTSIFGQIVESEKIKTSEVLVEKFDTEIRSFNLKNYHSYYTESFWTYRKLTGLYLKIGKRIYKNSTVAYYVLNPKSIDDVLEFWNLRSNGWYLYPISIDYHLEKSNELETVLIKSLNANGYDIRGLMSVKVIKSSSISVEKFSAFLRYQVFDKFKLIVQPYVPRMWDSKYWVEDDVVCVDLESDSSEVSFTNKDHRVIFAPIGDESIDDKTGYSDVKYAIDISEINWNSNTSFCEIFPDSMELSDFYNEQRYPNYRISRKGYTILNKFHDLPNISFWLIKSELLFKNWASANGYDLEISSPGKITYRMLHHFEYPYQIRRTIGRAGAIELLDSITDSGIDGKSLEDKIKQVFKTGKGSTLASNFIRELVECGIIQAGFSFSCTECGQKNWYPLTNLAYTLDCTKCLFEFSPPTWEYREFNLNYRTIGTFSLPRKAMGVYPVLFTYLFFKENNEFRSTSIFSFNLIDKTNRKQLEVDLAMFVQKKGRPNSEKRLILVEAKTFAPFKSIDIRRMKTLGRKFVNSVIVFATLSNKLSSNEKKLITDLLKYNQIKENQDKPFNEIIILTANELLDYQELSWGMDGELSQEYWRIAHTKSELTAIAKIFQKKYLS